MVTVGSGPLRTHRPKVGFAARIPLRLIDGTLSLFDMESLPPSSLPLNDGISDDEKDPCYPLEKHVNERGACQRSI